MIVLNCMKYFYEVAAVFSFFSIHAVSLHLKYVS